MCTRSEKSGAHTAVILITQRPMCFCLSPLRPPPRKLPREGMLYSVVLSRGGRGVGFKWYIKGQPKTRACALLNSSSHRRWSKLAVTLSIFWHHWVTLANFPFQKRTQALGSVQALGKVLLCSRNPTNGLYFRCSLISVANNVGFSLLAYFQANFLKCI